MSREVAGGRWREEEALCCGAENIIRDELAREMPTRARGMEL